MMIANKIFCACFLFVLGVTASLGRLLADDSVGTEMFNCGSDGENCCSGGVCNPGNVCADSGACEECGKERQPCCSVGASGGCGFRDGITDQISNLVCNAITGTCQKCGDRSAGCCELPTPPCKSGLVCNSRVANQELGVCTPCGAVGGQCCDDGPGCLKPANQVVDVYCAASGICESCGSGGLPCCPGNTCDNMEGRAITCSEGRCVNCGWDQEPCCRDRTCDSSSTLGPLVCGIDGKCKSCGGDGDHCCVDRQCGGSGLICNIQNRCKSCGGWKEPCCKNHKCGYLTDDDLKEGEISKGQAENELKKNGKVELVCDYDETCTLPW